MIKEKEESPTRHLKDSRLIGIVSGVMEQDTGTFVSTSLLETVGGVQKGTHIRFDLKDWKGGSGQPQKDQVVSFGQVSLFRRGWRATDVQPILLQSAIKERVVEKEDKK